MRIIIHHSSRQCAYSSFMLPKEVNQSCLHIELINQKSAAGCACMGFVNGWNLKAVATLSSVVVIEVVINWQWKWTSISRKSTGMPTELVHGRLWCTNTFAYVIQTIFRACGRTERLCIIHFSQSVIWWMTIHTTVMGSSPVNDWERRWVAIGYVVKLKRRCDCFIPP